MRATTTRFGAYYVLGRICYQTDRKEEASKYTKIFADIRQDR
jgi:hypothetical protein